MNTTDKVIRKGKKYSITEASPDDPIYNKGFVVGGVTSKRSSKNIREIPSDNSKKQKSRKKEPKTR